MEIRVDGQSLIVESTRFSARFDGAALASLVDRKTGTEFVRSDEATFPLELFYIDKKTLGVDKGQNVTLTPLSTLAARIVVSGNDSDRELFVRLDPGTGDLCIRPSGQSARRGVVSVRWNVPFVKEAELVLPCVNGIHVTADRPFPSNDRFAWPYRWNAQLAIAQVGNCSMMLHSEDMGIKFKALDLSRAQDGSSSLGFESEQVGPLWENRNAGGVEWRINTYDGDWKVPAGRFRDWMSRAYDLEAKRAARPDWVDEIDFTAQWTGSDPALLDALAKLHPPKKTLIHLAQWRTSAYDVDYPDYFPTEEAKEFMRRANEMGFRVMPHFNYFCCFNGHPLYIKLKDWQIREPFFNEPQGWYYPFDSHTYTRMSYIHPGLGLLRRTIIDAVLEASRGLAAPAIFIDQTLCTWNTDNGLVENMNTIEGMQLMQEEFCAIEPGIVLVGEGLTEISFQRECFGQCHIHDGWGDLEERHVEAVHPVGSFLWQGHARLVGYYHLNPGGKDTDKGTEIYRRLGAIPSIIPRGNIDLIDASNPDVKKILDLV